MKYLLSLLVILTLSACYEDSVETDNGPGPGQNSPTDPQNPSNPKLVWGELKCQKNLSCKNPVLNLDIESLSFFFESRFSIEQEVEGASESRSFHCGQKFFEEWVEFYPHHQNIESSQVNEISRFGAQLLDLKKCVINGNLKNNINNYLILTKEYKNVY